MRPARHVEIAQPRTFSERQKVGSACSSKLSLTIPMLVDDMDDSVARAYNALPDRLFLIDADAKIAYRGDRGPRGFKVDELEKALESMLKVATPEFP